MMVRHRHNYGHGRSNKNTITRVRPTSLDVRQRNVHAASRMVLRSPSTTIYDARRCRGRPTEVREPRAFACTLNRVCAGIQGVRVRLIESYDDNIITLYYRQ